MISSVSDFQKVFFIGVAGAGMSAIAQFLSGTGKIVSGSDRYFIEGQQNETREKLEAAGIKCYAQDGSGITEETELIVVSTAIEDTVYEVQKAKELSIPIIKRSELLAHIARSKKTIAIGGTSGKSTTSAMLFDILKYAGLSPSIISGAGLVSIIKDGKIGNAEVGEGEWLVIEADESDGSIVEYRPEIGLLLNVDKDHQEMEELMDIFTKFKHNTTKQFIVNRCNEFSRVLSSNIDYDFSSCEESAGIRSVNFRQEGLEISFEVNGIKFTMNTIGRHNMENALAAISVATYLGVEMESCARALANYEGIYRRTQVLGKKGGIMVIDDYAHNPVKCAAAIRACQDIAGKVVAWFQPHGYGPTKFLKNDFIKEISEALRMQDEIWMSEIFYAGGTAVKDISANDLIEGIKLNDKNAFFVSNREQLVDMLRSHLSDGSVLLLMGARDPGLEQFSKSVYEKL